MKKVNRTILFLIFTVLGFIVALQFRSTLQTKQDKSTAMQNIERLVAQVEQEKKTQVDLMAKIEENNTKKDEYLRSYIELNNGTMIKNVWDELNNAKLMAGLMDVEGPGVSIKLDDAAVRKTDDPTLLIIHDNDIRIILNELKKAGAQAISINGERIVITSEQLCAGPTIRINKEVYSVPYRINVIGNPENLYYSLMMSERTILMRKQGIRITVNKSNKILVEKYRKDPSKLISSLGVIEW